MDRAGLARSTFLLCSVSVEPQQDEIERDGEADPGQIWNKQSSGERPDAPEERDHGGDG